MADYRFAVVVEKDKEGYFAYCPELQGCYTQGETFEEAVKNIKDAVKLHVKDRFASNEPVTTSEIVSREEFKSLLEE
ncbi:MAG: type II toxin-antitoxin system HicB family antitoxin [Dehalococcoidales bacterium]|nr:type II toxin-antitoxin system HicB family antitoxin [Dehalococcoidales bacterium]